MNELFEIADDFTVFRGGKYVGTHVSKDATRDDIIPMMVGRDPGTSDPAQVAVGSQHPLCPDRHIAIGVTQVIISSGPDLNSGSITGATAMISMSLAQVGTFERALTDMPAVVPVLVGLLVALSAVA